METLNTSPKNEMKSKRADRSPSARLGLDLKLNLPTERIFYFYKEEDKDQGSIYYPASLFYKLYKRKERLGEGTASVVRRYVKKSSGERFSVKITRTRDDEIFSQIKEEFENMRELKHKNVINYHELYYDEFKGLIYLVMESFEGRELKTLIKEKNGLDEDMAKLFLRDMIKGAVYLHSQGVVHRDLKPSNILVSTNMDQLKILDFNVAKFTKATVNYCCGRSDNYELSDITGTPSFSAPEMLIGDTYTESVDAWSIGCILYIMLTNTHPFEKERINDLTFSIVNDHYDIQNEAFKNLSEDAKDLISKLLNKNPEKRITLGDAFYHKWLVQEDKKFTVDSENKLKSFNLNLSKLSKQLTLDCHLGLLSCNCCGNNINVATTKPRKRTQSFQVRPIPQRFLKEKHVQRAI